MAFNLDRPMTTAETSAYLDEKFNIQRSPSRLKHLRWGRGGYHGPAFAKVGNEVRYLPQDVDAWVGELIAAGAQGAGKKTAAESAVTSQVTASVE